MKFNLTVTAIALSLSAFLFFTLHKSKVEEPEARVIACYEPETPDSFQTVAVTEDFAAMHPAPKQLDDQELLGKMIQFPTNDGSMANAYFIAPPKKSTQWLIVIQEWWGLNEHIKREADKYFKDLNQVNVLAVDLFDGKVASTPDSAMKLMRGVNNDRIVAIIQAAIRQAGPKAAIYSVGWCFGGMWSLQTAILAGKQAKGTVMFYGRPESNLEKLQSLQCDILGFFGNLDKSPSPEMVNEFEKNMKSVGKTLTTYKYDAGHGFANPSNPSFNASASADAYSKALEFLKARMK